MANLFGVSDFAGALKKRGAALKNIFEPVKTAEAKEKKKKKRTNVKEFSPAEKLKQD